jgi:hypothetical protein
MNSLNSGVFKAHLKVRRLTLASQLLSFPPLSIKLSNNHNLLYIHVLQTLRALRLARDRRISFSSVTARWVNLSGSIRTRFVIRAAGGLGK